MVLFNKRPEPYISGLFKYMKISNGEISRTAELFDERGIDYRIIGSRAVSLLGLKDDITSGDIDILVSRLDMPAVPEIRRDLRREFGKRVVLGTLPSLSTIDFRNDKPSELQHRAIRMRLDENTMAAKEVDGVKTLHPHTLSEMYGTIGGVQRKKDEADKAALIHISEEDPDPTFHEFREEREHRYPMYVLSKRLGAVALKAVPKSIKLLSQDIIEERMEARYV